MFGKLEGEFLISVPATVKLQVSREMWTNGIDIRLVLVCWTTRGLVGW